MIDRVNRTILVILALVLIVGGAALVALNQGWLQAALPRRVLEPGETYTQASQAVASRPELWWPIILAAAVVIGLLGLWWVLRQIPVPGPPVPSALLARNQRGSTRLETSAAERALAADLGRLSGVASSRVRMTDVRPPRVRVGLDLDGRADQRRVRDAAEACYDRLARAIGSEGLTVRTTIRLDRGPVSRVI